MKNLMWRVPPTNAGFRLLINRTCSAVCNHYCDVEVTLTYHNLHKSKDGCLRGSGFHTNISDIKEGSWNDAAAFCEKQGLQLLSPDVVVKEEHDFSSLSCKLPTHLDGRDLMGQAFFAGLYEMMKVTDTIDSLASNCKIHHKTKFQQQTPTPKNIYCNQSFSSAACYCTKMNKQADLSVKKRSTKECDSTFSFIHHIYNFHCHLRKTKGIDLNTYITLVLLIPRNILK